MRFGIHHSSWLDGPDPAEAFEAVKLMGASPGATGTTSSQVRSGSAVDPHPHE